jgi:hypothetical protein
VNERICVTGGARRVVALAVLAATALLTAACSSPSRGGGATGSMVASAAYRANIAFAQCMRTHGVPTFPDPGPSTNFAISGTPAGPPTTPSAKAYDTCKHLLPSGSGSGNGSVTSQELREAVALAQCLRNHGEPSFPDPTVIDGSVNFAFTSVTSPQFRTAVKDCGSVIPAGVKLP